MEESPNFMQKEQEVQFSKAELERYSRHLILPEFNIEGQRKLKQAKVLVVGSGGLGSPLLLYLAAAGVGKIGIVDNDKVEETNLQRQVLFGMQEIGSAKVETAKRRMLDLNPHIQIETYEALFTSSNALDILQGYDIVADGTDNFPTRYLVNDAAVLLGIPNVYASIFRFEGQVSVFNYTHPNGELGPNYRDLYPTPPPPGAVPSCAEGGVLGVLPGIIGSMQALEVIKVLSGVGEPLSGRIFIYDALDFSSHTLKISRDPANPLNGENPTQQELIDYVQFCGMPYSEDHSLSEASVAELTVEELCQWKEEGKDHLLIDVREPYEYEIAQIGGKLIPKGQIEKHLDQIPKDRPVVLHCRSGKRSAEVIEFLKDTYGYKNLLNLQGGILAYAERIDEKLARY